MTAIGDKLDQLLTGMDAVSLWLARLGGALILATVALVTIEVLSRSLLGRSLGASTELSGYVMAISASWSFAYTLLRKAHIRIDVLYVLVPGYLRAAMDLLALAMFALFCLFVVDAAVGVAVDSLAGGSTANTPLQTPLWIPQTLWAIGFIWFSAVVAVLLLRAVVALIGGDTGAVQRLAGSATLDTHAQSESRKERS